MLGGQLEMLTFGFYSVLRCFWVFCILVKKVRDIQHERCFVYRRVLKTSSAGKEMIVINFLFCAQRNW